MLTGIPISISYAQRGYRRSVSHYSGEFVQRQVAPADKEEKRSCKEIGYNN